MPISSSIVAGFRFKARQDANPASAGRSKFTNKFNGLGKIWRPRPGSLAKSVLPLQERASGEMAEWLKAHAWKACVRETVPWVRIPLSPPFARFCAPNYDLLRSYAFEPSLVRDSVGARPRRATLRIAVARAIATMVGSIVLARAFGDKRLSDTLLEAGRQALHHQAAGASAGACPADRI